MRRVLPLIAAALIFASCGSDVVVAPDDSGPSSPDTVSTTVPTSTTASTPGASSTTTSPGSTSSTTTPLPPIDGPEAPDFALELSDGSTFVLSEEARPVYLVFWAEW